MSKADRDLVIRLREHEDAAAGFALVRDRDRWGHLLARASMPTLWLGPERSESRLLLAGEAGYLWGWFGREGGAARGEARARMLEFGEVEPRAALPVLLDDLFEECRRRQVAEVEAWLTPAEGARDPRLRAAARRAEPPRVVPMCFPLEARAGAELDRHASCPALRLADSF